MSILPGLVPNLQKQVNNISNSTNAVNTGKSFLFDFEAGDFVIKDGMLLEVKDIEALKVWIKKILKTEKHKFAIYTGLEYGATLQDLLDKGYSTAFIQSEIIREVTDALSTDVRINSVTNFTFTRKSKKLNVSFVVSSIYGSTEIEVIF